MNNKGFTLIELIATILVLALVMSIASYSIINVIRSAKQKNYDLLIEQIKDASEVYFQECKYANNSGISCNSIDNGYTITLGELVTYGYLKGNDPDNNNSLINPLNNNNIGSCKISIIYSDGALIVNNIDSSSECINDYGDDVDIDFSLGDNDIDRDALKPSIPVNPVKPKF